MAHQGTWLTKLQEQRQEHEELIVLLPEAQLVEYSPS